MRRMFEVAGGDILPEEARLCVRRLRDIFREAGIESAALDARLLTAHAVSRPMDSFLFGDAPPLSERSRSWLAAAARRRLQGAPVSRLLGRRAFWKSDFLINDFTLDPRPESETIIENVLELLPSRAEPLDILDLGTGSGCLLLSLLLEMPRARGVGVDRVYEALLMARRNAERLNLEGRARFFLGDWASACGAPFDVIVANPPYIKERERASLPSEVRHDPAPALYGGESGLEAYARLIPMLAPLLKETGFAVIEMGCGQERALRNMAERSSLVIERVAPDLSGVPRVFIARARREKA